MGAIGRISKNESCLGTLGLPADFAASAATSLRWRIYGVNMVRNPSPAISSVPEPLFPRWSKVKPKFALRSTLISQHHLRAIGETSMWAPKDNLAASTVVRAGL